LEAIGLTMRAPYFYPTPPLLLTLEDCRTRIAELIDAIGPSDQWIANDHDALLDG
jgi:hypothetical protein